MTRLLVPIVTTGLFCVLAAYSYGRYVDVPHARLGNTKLSGCGLEWACLKAWADGKPTQGLDTDGMNRLVKRSLADAKRHKRLAGNDEQAELRYLWGDGE